ncbi:hypothetical protein NC653_001138 [Populus alba x Populus x berolinensis]|uniref:Uncharacterized protein n=1 Tax=Populus alba x Populus x berolinensis TaxID=444605 RepID=A0AAD6RLH1_9ROSI|nr:hypothetical protein NC653_001138 [Populus alba x Populus x berolinensis]
MAEVVLFQDASYLIHTWSASQYGNLDCWANLLSSRDQNCKSRKLSSFKVVCLQLCAWSSSNSQDANCNRSSSASIFISVFLRNTSMLLHSYHMHPCLFKNVVAILPTASKLLHLYHIYALPGISDAFITSHFLVKSNTGYGCNVPHWEVEEKGGIFLGMVRTLRRTFHRISYGTRRQIYERALFTPTFKVEGN